MRAHLHTTHLDLRPLGRSDVESLHALCVRPEVRRHLFDDRIASLDEVGGLVEESRSSFCARGFGLWGLRAEASSALVGFCGLAFLPRHGAVEILYALAPEHWGRGLAVEAARAVLSFGFERCGLARIVGETDLPNRASQRVLERLGMQREAESVVEGRPLVQYAIAREAYFGADAQPEM